MNNKFNNKLHIMCVIMCFVKVVGNGRHKVISDSDWGISDVGVRLNGRQAHEVEGFYIEICERHKFMM